MKKILITTMLCFLMIFSCKDTRETNDSTENKKSPKIDHVEKDHLQVIISAIVPVSDYFEVYYYEPGLETFHSNDFVVTEVKGSSSLQNINFDLPSFMFPERLRLDFGKISDQGIIKLNSVTLVYNSKSYEFSKEEIQLYFKPSKFIDFDTETFEIKTKQIDGKYDPYFYTPKLNNIVNFLRED